MKLDEDAIVARMRSISAIGALPRSETVSVIRAICDEFNLQLEQYVDNAPIELLEAAGVMLIERYTLRAKTEREEAERLAALRAALRAEPYEARRWSRPKFCRGPSHELAITMPKFHAWAQANGGTAVVLDNRIEMRVPISKLPEACAMAADLDLWPGSPAELWNLDAAHCSGCGVANDLGMLHAERCRFSPMSARSPCPACGGAQDIDDTHTDDRCPLNGEPRGSDGRFAMAEYAEREYVGGERRLDRVTGPAPAKSYDPWARRRCPECGGDGPACGRPGCTG